MQRCRVPRADRSAGNDAIEEQISQSGTASPVDFFHSVWLSSGRVAYRSGIESRRWVFRKYPGALAPVLALVHRCSVAKSSATSGITEF
jgi:hypothetical protein